MRVSLVAERRLASLPQLASAVRRLCRQVLDEPNAVIRAEIALVEACTNSVVHAPTGDGTKLRVDLTWRTGAVEMVVTDDGPAYDLEAAMMPEVRGHDPASIPTGGFGLPLIKACADLTEYRRDGETNVLRIVVRRRHA